MSEKLSVGLKSIGPVSLRPIFSEPYLGRGDAAEVVSAAGCG